jgi:signal transduction histidine kinase
MSIRKDNEAPMILLVDDDAAHRRHCRGALEDAGFAVIEAAAGGAVVEQCLSRGPDAVLLDAAIGEAIGEADVFALCRAVRRGPGGAQRPVLIMTDGDADATIERGLAAGASDFVTKPVNRLLLVGRLRAALELDGTRRLLKLNQRRLAEAQRLGGIGDFRWEPPHQTVACSAEAARILGAAGEARTIALPEVLRRLASADRVRLRKAVRAALAGGVGCGLDLNIDLPGDPACSVRLRAHVVQEGDADPHLQGTLQDVSEAQRVEAALARARAETERVNAAKTTILANMSHELRTPLNAIIGFSEIISEETFGPINPPTYRAYASDILNAGRHMYELVSDVLHMAKLEAGGFELIKESVDLHQLLETTVAVFRGWAMAKDRPIVVRIGNDCSRIDADERAVRQMVLNLLSNAVKFSEPGTAIRVHCSRGADGSTRLSVIDGGIGMTAQEAELAVQPFHQIDGRLQRRVEGTGLGLSITKKLIECHGGRLAITSVPRFGSCISLEFPGADGMAPTAAAA